LKFNRWTLLGYAALFSLMTLWMQFKGKEAKAVREKFVADSLAKVEKAPKPVSQKGDAFLGAVDGEVDGASDGTSAEGNLEDTLVGEAALAADSALVGDSATRAAQAARDTLPKVSRQLITIKTKRFTAVLDNQGARLAEVRLDSLHGKPLHNEVIIDGKQGGALTLSLNQQDLGKILWRSDAQRTSYDLVSDSLRIVFTARAKDGRELKRAYTFFPDSNAIAHRASVPGQVNTWALSWAGGLSETEPVPEGTGFGLMSNYFSEVIFDNSTNATRETFTGKKSFNAESGVVRWVGLRRKYVAALLDFNRETGNRIDAEGFLPEGQEDGFPPNYKVKISNGQWEEGALDFDFKILPLQYDRLKAYDRNYEKILFTGWESFFRADIWYVKLCGLVLNLLNFFHSVIPNWGIAIILLTLLVRFVTLPLTLSQTRQMAKMQEHQPEINKIRERNKGEPQKAHAEMMAYYKQVGISPLAPVLGCFPMLLQMPIFIALFNVLGRSVELKDAYFFGWITDLSLPDVIVPAFKVPYLFPVGLTVLPFLMAATMYFQMKLTVKDPNQRAMIWMMPIIMFVFSCSFPSGLVLYWSVSNIFTIVQTYIQTNKLKLAESTRKAAAGDAKPAVKAKPIIGTRDKGAKKK
jgi:YidC/Oxa1 family membrane protein insertase